jgi:hypothetical protein
MPPPPKSFLRTRNTGKLEVASERRGPHAKHDATTLRNRSVGLDIWGEQYAIPPPISFVRVRGRANNNAKATPKALDVHWPDPTTKWIHRRVHHLATGIALEVEHFESSAARSQGVQGPGHAEEEPPGSKAPSPSAEAPSRKRASVRQGTKKPASGRDSLLSELSLGSDGPQSLCTIMKE